jgi:transaldolase/glucose-6-phosphate isomerase
MSNPLTELVAIGQSPWIDFIRRTFMTDGSFGKLISANEIHGATSNPTIFEKAIGGSSDYDDQLTDLVKKGITDPKKIFDELAIVDIQMAADLLRPVYDRTNGADGFISLEVSPGAANDTQATLSEARYLWGRVQRPNLMIKVPATPDGIPAVEQLLTEGINVNITLMFAVAVYEQVAQAYVNALRKRVAAGQPVDRIASVASFFVSRVDTEGDKRLDALAANAPDEPTKQKILGLRGKAAIANAKLAYERFQAIFGAAFDDLKARGAHVQRPLWASTSTKNPAYRDVLYVEELIGPDTVDTMPPATVDAFRDHGQVRLSITEDVAGAHQVMQDLASVGLDIDDITHKLLLDGVKSFADSYNELMDETARKVATMQQQTSGGSGAAPAGQSGSGSGAPRMSQQGPNIPTALAAPTSAALQQLDAARAGARLWDKDYTFWKSDPAVGQKIVDRLGWVDIARVMEPELRNLANFANDVRMQGYTDVVLLGMGGSSLGPEVLAATFGKQAGFPALRVLDSTDPAALLATERAVDLNHTLFIVASKSGSTLETLSHFNYFYAVVKGLKGEQQAARDFIAITDPGSSLDASAFPFRHVFRNPPDIGGRYSALSYFGLVPAALMGIDVNALLDSALAMTTACGKDVPAAQNPGLVLGAILGAGAQQGRDKITIIASPPIATVGLWIEQLIAESTGKEGRGLLPVANEPLGVPQVYGTDRLFVYLRMEEGFDPAQDEALSKLEGAGQPVVWLRLANRYALGGEFYRWEVATAIAGHFLNINPFDEPNVQESKDNTKRILAEFERQGRFTPLTPLVTDGGVRVAATGDTANAVRGITSVMQLKSALLKVAKPGDYVAIMAYLPPTAENDALLQHLRVAFRDAGKVATTVGYGPRFLHSTGQLHKGGANNGIFLQITSDEADDVRIPDQKYTFGNLIHAQSLGDYEALQAHGRRVARVALGTDVRGGLAKLAE